MRLIGLGCRTAGPRSYENAILDVGAVVFQHGEEMGSFHEFVRPDRYRSYRPDSMIKAGVSFDTLHASGLDLPDQAAALCEFLSGCQHGAAVWTFDLADNGPFLDVGARLCHSSIEGLTDVGSLWMVARSLGVQNEHGGRIPSLTSTMALLNYYGHEVSEWDTVDALERARMAAQVAGRIIEGIKGHARGKAPALEVASA